MTTALLDEVPEHFPMGRQRGRIVPTADRISDTASTPLGLSLRVEPATAEKWGPKPTSQATSIKSDGDQGEGSETQSDTTSDQTW